MKRIKNIQILEMHLLSSEYPEHGRVLNIPSNYLDYGSWLDYIYSQKALKKSDPLRLESNIPPIGITGDKLTEFERRRCIRLVCGFSFDVLLPGLKPPTLSNLQDFDTDYKKEPFGEYDKRYMHIMTTAIMANPQDLDKYNHYIERNLIFKLPFLLHSKKYYFDEYKNNELLQWTNIQKDAALNLDKIVSFKPNILGGLLVESSIAGTPANPLPNNYYFDVFINHIYLYKKHSKISTTIICKELTDKSSLYEDAYRMNWNNKPSPSCEHSFTIPQLELAVSLLYSGEHLQNWQSIQAQTTELLISFSAKGKS